jgi:hypothetical protein
MKMLVLLLRVCRAHEKLALGVFGSLTLAGCGAPVGDPGEAAAFEEVHAALAATPARITFGGRLVLPDPYDCTGGTTSAAMRWSACHAFKRHFDPMTGAAITSSSYVPNAMRPLTARVGVVYQAWPSGQICDSRWLQTDDSGNFSADLANCSADGGGVISYTVQLSAVRNVKLSSGAEQRTVRAIWPRDQIPQTYFAGDADVVYRTTDVNGTVTEFVVPTLSKNHFFTAPAGATTFQLGNEVIDGFDFGPAYRDYVRGALAAWQNLLGIHAKAQAVLAANGRDDLYARLFVSDPNCSTCYSLVFSDPGSFGGGVGGAGGFSTAAPAANVTESQVMALSSAGLIAHEFGHGINESLAPLSMAHDDSLHAMARNPDGSTYGVSHMTFVPTSSDVLQQQEAGQAMVEGFAEAMARFLVLDGCNGNSPTFDALGNSDMRTNMWNPDAQVACDSASGSGCPFHAFRAQMLARGIAEGSAEWNRRKSALVNLATTAASRGAARVFSNNEGKASQFFCKLLAAQPDYSSMAGKVLNQWYVGDYTYLVSEILDGRTPSVTWRRYTSDVSAFGAAHVTLSQLMQAMTQVCADCNQIPSPLPTAWWQLPSLTDGAQANYDSVRISVNGRLSPQNLGRILMSSGTVSKSRMNNLLRAAFMDEIP